MERIDCLAPLPEDPVSDLLTRVLFPAPYVVPEKKTKKMDVGTRKGLGRKVVSDSSSEDTKAHSSHEDEEEEEEASPPPAGGGKKRKTAPLLHQRR